MSAADAIHQAGEQVRAAALTVDDGSIATTGAEPVDETREHVVAVGHDGEGSGRCGEPWLQKEAPRLSKRLGLWGGPKFFDQDLFKNVLDLISGNGLAVDFAKSWVGGLGATDGHRVALAHDPFTIFCFGAS